jgi:hypothetical protein
MAVEIYIGRIEFGGNGAKRVGIVSEQFIEISGYDELVAFSPPQLHLC